MITGDQIHYITQKNIDKEKWDACINNSFNGLIYANSWYLDAMSKHWDALVLNNYEAVMPLTWNKKWSFYYIYQPFFTPSLGVFGKKNIDLLSFLNAIPSKFKYWDIDVNEANSLINNTLNIAYTNRINYTLDLTKAYPDIYANYKRLAKRMLKKASDAHIEVVRDISPTEIISLYRQEYKYKHTGIPDKLYDRLTACTEIAFNKKQAKTYLAKSSDHQVVAFYLLLTDNNYIYSLLGGSTSKGQEMGAFYLLTDAAIKDHAATNRKFRFEGSDLEGIAFFNKQFCPEKINYLHIKRNNLPWPIRVFK